MRLISAIILIVLCPLTCVLAVEDIVLPWSTTFDCDDWAQDGAIVCADDEDALREGGGWTATCPGGSEPCVITSGANYSGGGGKKGLRNYAGPGENNGGGPPWINLSSGYNEIWVRWYMRYSPADTTLWDRVHYHKILYTNYYGNSEPDIIPEWGDGVFAFGYQSVPDNPGYTTEVTWASIMGGDLTSDGEWHYYEVHMKIDTNGSDGILELWIDNDDTPKYQKTDADLGGLSAGVTYFKAIELITNQDTVEDGICMAIDLDDIAISATGQIGEVDSPVSKSGCNPIGCGSNGGG